MKQKRKRKTKMDVAREATEVKLKTTVMDFLEKQKIMLTDPRDKIMMGAAIAMVAEGDAHELSQWIGVAIEASFLERYGQPPAKEVFPPRPLVMNNGEEIPGSPITGDPLSGEA